MKSWMHTSYGPYVVYFEAECQGYVERKHVTSARKYLKSLAENNLHMLPAYIAKYVGRVWDHDHWVSYWVVLQEMDSQGKMTPCEIPLIKHDTREAEYISYGGRRSGKTQAFMDKYGESETV